MKKFKCFYFLKHLKSTFVKDTSVKSVVIEASSRLEAIESFEDKYSNVNLVAMKEI
jgi:hypothetical protein